MKQTSVQVAVIGASLGGVMAAWQLCRAGIRTLLTSEFSWIGGQLTSQAVPPDEHPHIEFFGASESYRAFRAAVRRHYLTQPEFVDNTSMTEGCNPGDGWVSRLCFEPAVAEEYLRSLLRPFIDSGLLTLIEAARPVTAVRNGRSLESVTVAQGRRKVRLCAVYFIDGTDTGALLKLADLPYRLGKESREEFDEPQAPEHADRMDQQPVTFVCALGRADHPSAPIARPAEYDFWHKYKLPHYDHRIFSNQLPGHEGFGSIQLPFFSTAAFMGDYSDRTLDLWRYRRIVAAHNWQGQERQDISLINWAQNDYALKPLLDGCDSGEDEVSAAAKALTRCFVYWLQTEAPRSSLGEVGRGFPELVLAEKFLGTADGFAQQIYVRESRRIVGLQTLSQRDILLPSGESGWRPLRQGNSVGIGLYNMDIHPTCMSGMGSNAAVRPFELPLGVFIPVDVDNLLPASKNIGVTHLVNAATRVHPIEWLVGEVAGLLASLCLAKQVLPADIYGIKSHTTDFQQLLQNKGVPLHWPEHISSRSAQD
ncbi:FAD-dependent oxidoreductase [Microbulbifer sp. TYP-18]|uniref:FAD-dependent oxidoreductase n=1 Tax=Microbulbifer sp. TYP-18 TaxID=3230024 RepID=UPI0034C5B2E8